VRQRKEAGLEDRLGEPSRGVGGVHRNATPHLEE